MTDMTVIVHPTQSGHVRIVVSSDGPADDHSGVATILPPVIGVDRERPRVEIVIRETGGVSHEATEGAKCG